MSGIDPVVRFNETMIDDYADKLDYLSREYRETKEDLSAFLMEYYDKVGPFLGRMSHGAGTRRVSADSKPHSFSLPPLNIQKREGTTRSDVSLQVQIRELYLLLVRKLHPDQGAQLEKEELLKQVTGAYHEGSIGTLWKISFELEWDEIRRLPQGTRQGFLLHYHQLLQDAVGVMERNLRGVYDSPEYQLQQRVFTARLRGEDLLSRIVEHLEEEADRQTRRLEFRKMRQQLMDEAVWA